MSKFSDIPKLNIYLQEESANFGTKEFEINQVLIFPKMC